MNYENAYAKLLQGSAKDSLLLTDGYKFSMGEVGYPLRHETFYLHFRKGGAQFIPFDLEAVVTALRPTSPTDDELKFLKAHNYTVTSAMDLAINSDFHVWAQPKGTWANEREPVLTLRGPSFLVSWFEPLLIALQFPIQIATALLEGVSEFHATCQDEGAIIKLVAQSMGKPEPKVTIRTEDFCTELRSKIAALKRALDGRIERAFEVGTRSMTCYQHHQMVLWVCKAFGIRQTANVKGAFDSKMEPVGTTGHEHQQRFGEDIEGFRALRDRYGGRPTYLFDTYDPMQSGIPAAVATMLENRKKVSAVRFDSGDQVAQLKAFRQAETQCGIRPMFLFMDGYDAERVAHMESEADKLRVPIGQCLYGIGGWFVIDPQISPYNRNRIAMVYKLCQTGGPDGALCRNVRKYSGTPDKASLAGRPVVAVAHNGTRYICQQDEDFVPPTGFLPNTERVWGSKPTTPSLLSPATVQINRMCEIRDLNSKGVL